MKLNSSQLLLMDIDSQQGTAVYEAKYWGCNLFSLLDISHWTIDQLF